MDNPIGCSPGSGINKKEGGGVAGNFQPHNSKGAVKKYVRPKKLAADILSNICQKGSKKGRKLYLSSFF
jgi:hypothetical protein